MASSEPKKQDLERLEALKRTLREDPRSLAFVTLAEAHNRLGQHAEAADVAQRGLLSHPDSVAGRLALAVAEAEQDHIREALEQIKRALIIDQENPKALALMGRILLKRGLAKRAVQFLSHAVKLEPKNGEYADLLRRARKMARGEAVEESVPVFDAASVPSSGDNPWAADDDADGMAQTTDGLVESEHTVFDPDALKQLQGKKSLRKPGKATGPLQKRLDALPEVGDFHEEEEPTAYLDNAGKLDGSGSVVAPDVPDAREEPTAFAAPNPLAEGVPRRAKVGGSAAEYSQMMKRADADRAREEAEARVRTPPSGELGSSPKVVEPPSSPEPKVRSRPSIEAPSKSAVRPPMEAPSVRKARTSGANAAPEVERVELVDASAVVAQTPSPVAAPEPEVKAEPKAAATAEPKPAVKAEPKPEVKAEPKAAAKAEPKAAAKAEPKAEAPAPNKQVGHVATRMVDDALWALYGKSGPEADAPASEPAEPEAQEEAPKKKAPVRAKLRGKDAPVKPSAKGKADAGGEGKGPMVVRTSKRFGAWTRAAAVLVAAVAAGFLGHWVALASAGPGPEVASEELKGIATDMERGGLASLLAAEDQITVLSRSSPDLSVLLEGVLAEIYARRWSRFGRSDELRKKAFEKLEAAAVRAPTVEVLAAQTLLSTSSASREAIRAALSKTRLEYPDSPKTHLVEGWAHRLDGREDRAIEAFYAAYQLHPQHRGTLLAIARWHASRGAYGTAFDFFERLQDKFPDDVEVAIERYVLGQLSGQDPRAAEAVSTLAGLVREEIPQVAKDEAGRAALAFAVPRFAEGELGVGIQELEKAEAAFDNSPAFKRALGGAFIAVGAFERAAAQFDKAVKLGGDSKAARIGLARARLGKAARFAVDLTEEGERIRARAGADAPRGRAELPFGTLSFVPGQFELVALEPRADVFPEDEYAALANTLDGEALQKALDAASLVALGQMRGRKGDCDSAVRHFAEANALAPSPAARFGLARCRLDAKQWSSAESALAKALDEEPDFVPGWLMLARARAAQGNNIGTISALERFESMDPVVPDAMHLLGLARLARGDWEKAARDLKVATEHLPRAWRAQLAYGEALHALGRGDEALEAHRRALATQPRLARSPKRRGSTLSPVQLMYLGRLLAEDKPKRGVPLLKESLRHEASPLETQFYLGKALIASRKTRKEGKRALEKYVRVGPDGELRDQAERLLRKR